MKIPAIRAKIGNWIYYISTLSFQQVTDHVEKIDDQLHKSKGLQDLIQRSITKNYESIKDYILNQEERFFNSLVLAVYNGNPKWIEVELSYEDEEYFNMGFLDFSSEEKIFPVDGQHRVEGIKAALKENVELKNEQIGAIFIGHSLEEEGMKRSRRLFTTLNRYAKPVTMDDIIALDEDDSIAIVTRYLLENFNLFKDDRVTKSKNKAILDTDKTSITSIITLYQCNRELLKIFRQVRKTEAPDNERDKRSMEHYLKFRPKEVEINLYLQYTLDYWNSLVNNIDTIKTFINIEDENPASIFRNRENGGHLLFRPVGLLPFVQATVEIHKRSQQTFDQIFSKFNSIDFSLNNTPWRNVLWNPNEKTMIMGTTGTTKLLFLYIFNTIRNGELSVLKIKYADKLNLTEEEDINEVLADIKTISHI